MSLDKTKYLEMPISRAEKQDWNARGYRVADIRFMPEDFDNDESAQEDPKGEPTRPDSVDDMGKKALGEWLKAQGVVDIPNGVEKRRELAKALKNAG